jgi:hypothetical protein
VTRATIAVWLLALMAAVAIVLLDERPRAVESVSRSLRGALVVPPFAIACEPEVDIPMGAGRVEVVGSTAGKAGPPLLVTVRQGSRVVTTARHPGGYIDTPVSIRLGRKLPRVRDARVCVRNHGLVRIALLGAPLRFQGTTQGWIDEVGAPAGPAARVTAAGKVLRQQHTRIRFEWQFADEQRPLSMVGDVSERFGLAKASFFGSGAIWVAFGLTLASSLGALILFARESGRR